MKQYRPRIVDAVLARKLEGMGAVLIEGAKWWSMSLKNQKGRLPLEDSPTYERICQSL